MYSSLFNSVVHADMKRIFNRSVQALLAGFISDMTSFRKSTLCCLILFHVIFFFTHRALIMPLRACTANALYMHSASAIVTQLDSIYLFIQYSNGDLLLGDFHGLLLICIFQFITGCAMHDISATYFFKHLFCPFFF